MPKGYALEIFTGERGRAEQCDHASTLCSEIIARLPFQGNELANVNITNCKTCHFMGCSCYGKIYGRKRWCRMHKSNKARDLADRREEEPTILSCGVTPTLVPYEEDADSRERSQLNDVVEAATILRRMEQGGFDLSGQAGDSGQIAIKRTKF